MATKPKTSETAPDDALVTLHAIVPINFNGVDYAPGDELQIDAAGAQNLLAVGAAELA